MERSYKKRALLEIVMKIVFLAAACMSVLCVALICIFLFANGLPTIFEIGPLKFLLGTTWKPGNNLYGILPMILQAALKDFQKAMRYVRREFKKRGYEVFWIRNIERGTKGAWHIHLVINEIGDTASIITKAWTKGGTWSIEIKNSKYYDEDFTKLANYMTKDEHTTEEKKDGKPGKPRLSEASYNTSRNMPLPEPKVDKLRRWKEEPKPKKGYYIAKIHEGINPVTRYKYRRYTMIRLKRRRE